MRFGIYDDKAIKVQRFTRLMWVLNVAFTVAVLFGWGAISGFIEPPIVAATEAGIANHPRFDEYPYALLWVLPIGGVMLSWAAAHGGYGALSRFAAAYPVILITFAVLWFYYLSDTYI